ncbi:hypothetical protein L1887_14684 [Cichorium endivia]|nr:hypothetical protein L1887_14684 [Cichorium endivia]
MSTGDVAPLSSPSPNIPSQPPKIHSPTPSPRIPSPPPTSSPLFTKLANTLEQEQTYDPNEDDYFEVVVEPKCQFVTLISVIRFQHSTSFDIIMNLEHSLSNPIQNHVISIAKSLEDEIRKQTDMKLIEVVTKLNFAHSEVQAQLATLIQSVAALSKQTAEVQVSELKNL